MDSLLGTASVTRRSLCTVHSRHLYILEQKTQAVLLLYVVSVGRYMCIYKRRYVPHVKTNLQFVFVGKQQVCAQDGGPSLVPLSQIMQFRL